MNYFPVIKAGRILFSLALTAMAFLQALMCSPSFSYAETSSGISLEILSALRVEVEPRQVVCASLRVRNETGERLEVLPSIQLPEGWSLVLPPNTFSLQPGEDYVLFVSVLIPLNVRAGEYPIRLSLSAKERPAIKEEVSITAFVKAVANVQVLAPKQPLTVLAGDAYSRTFTVTSLSNVASRIRIEVSSQPDWTATVDNNVFSLEAGASQSVTVTVLTPRELVEETLHRLTLKAVALDLEGGAISNEGSVFTTVYPRMQVGSMYETLTGQGNILFALEDETGAIATQFAVELAGPLGDGRSGEFSVVGPFRSGWQDQPYTVQERIFAGYEDENRGGFRFGDISVDATPVTERYSYGRGAELQFIRDRFSLRLFSTSPRAGLSSKRLLGAQLSFSAPGNTEIKLTALSKKEQKTALSSSNLAQEGTIYSLYAHSLPLKGADFEAEYAWSSGKDGATNEGGSDSAYRLSARLKASRYSLDGEVVRAGVGFPGYWQDQQVVRAYFSVDLVRSVRLWFNLTETERNLSADPNLSQPKDSFRSLGLNFSAGPLGRVNVSRRWSRRRDITLKKWNEKEATTSFQLSHQIDWFSFGANIDSTMEEDFLTGKRFDSKNYRLLVSARFKPGLSVSAGYSLDTGEETATGEEKKEHQFWVNLDGEFHLNGSTEGTISFNRGESISGGVNWLRAEVKQHLPKDYTLSLKFQRQWGAFGGNTAIALQLTIPLNVPMRWFPKAGSIEGRIFDSDTGNPRVGVIVQIADQEVATDESGRFNFPSLKVGEHELTIDRVTLGLGTIPLVDFPIKVSVSPGQTVTLEVPVIRSATVKGRVLATRVDELLRPILGPAGEIQYLGAAGTLVVLTSGEKRIARVTDSDGGFVFADITPGDWKLIVPPNQVPQLYELVPEEYKLTLKPGEAMEDIEFILRPIRREVVITAGK